jgi:hypothetical protein
VITAFVNAALNGLIAWGSAAKEDSIDLWSAPLVGGPSTITDTVGTFFILPLVTTLLITTVVWHELKTGGLAPLRRSTEGGWLIGRLPKTRLRRGVYFGALCAALFAPVAVVLLVATDFGDISRGSFVLYKVIFGVALGAIVTPVIAIAALSDEHVAADALPADVTSAA